MANKNLMIEVVANATRAVNTLDKAIAKLSKLQHAFQAATPTVSRFSASLKTIPNNFNFQNVVNETIKVPAAFQKMQFQNEIAATKAQSAMAKTAFDTENYAFKSEKLAKAREKIDLIITIRINLESFSFCRLLKIHINIDF